MKGRPRQETQKFASAIASELPADNDPKCKPKSADAVDFFDFATLHELGHSVDDNLQYMASREGKPEFGNWRTHGNIDPIVDAVAAWYKYNSTPEQKRAVSDLIQGNQATWPTPPAGTPADKVKEWNDGQKNITNWHKLATREGVWEKESDTKKIIINNTTVFHLAYPRNWVSYDYAARKHGMTGYQFRAPGEWFAELYACYRMDKLQSSHPAIKWLSTLKV